MNYKIVIVYTSDKVKSYKKAIKGSNIDPEDTDFSAIHIYRKGHYSYLIFPKESTDPGTVAHECWHLIRHVFEHSGAKMDHELVGYHLGYLVNTVYSFLTSQKGNI